MIGRRFLRNSPPIVGIAAEGLEVEHRLPVQQVIRHQLALAVARAAEKVVGRLAETEDHDASQGVALVLGKVQPYLVRRAEEVERGLVIGNARQVDALPLAGVGCQAGEGRHVARGAHRHSLFFRQVEVVAGLWLEAGLERFRVEVDAQQPRCLRLDGLALAESTTLEERRPFIPDSGVWLDPKDQPPPAGGTLLQGIEHHQPLALGDDRPARHVVDRAAGVEAGAAQQRAHAGAAIVDDEPLDAPPEARLQLAPLPALQQVRLWLRQQ